MLDDAGRTGTELYGDRPAGNWHVPYLAYGPLVRVIISHFEADGISCCVARTTVDRFGIDEGQGTVSLVHVDPLQLFGGTLYAVVWVTDADEANGLSRATSGWFEVKNRTPDSKPETRCSNQRAVGPGDKGGAA